MKKILVIDDEPLLGDLISEFGLHRFDVRAEWDGRQAVEMAKEWRPDLITLDLEMPALNGLEVLRRLKASFETRDIPVVIVSVLGKGAWEEGLLNGARAVFEKPLNFRWFSEKLSQILSQTESTLRRTPALELNRRVTA